MNLQIVVLKVKKVQKKVEVPKIYAAQQKQPSSQILLKIIQLNYKKVCQNLEAAKKNSIHHPKYKISANQQNIGAIFQIFNKLRKKKRFGVV